MLLLPLQPSCRVRLTAACVRRCQTEGLCWGLGVHDTHPQLVVL